MPVLFSRSVARSMSSLVFIAPLSIPWHIYVPHTSPNSWWLGRTRDVRPWKAVSCGSLPLQVPRPRKSFRDAGSHPRMHSSCSSLLCVLCTYLVFLSLYKTDMENEMRFTGIFAFSPFGVNGIAPYKPVVAVALKAPCILLVAIDKPNL